MDVSGIAHKQYGFRPTARLFPRFVTFQCFAGRKISLWFRRARYSPVVAHEEASRRRTASALRSGPDSRRRKTARRSRTCASATSVERGDPAARRAQYAPPGTRSSVSSRLAADNPQSRRPARGATSGLTSGLSSGGTCNTIGHRGFLERRGMIWDCIKICLFQKERNNKNSYFHKKLPIRLGSPAHTLPDFSVWQSRSARSAAHPCTTSCSFKASEAIPISGPDSIFSNRCGAISGRLRFTVMSSWTAIPAAETPRLKRSTISLGDFRRDGGRNKHRTTTQLRQEIY